MTMFDTRLRLSNQVADEVRRYFGERVFETIVKRNVRLSEAPSFGKPALLYEASSTGAQNYMALAREIIGNNPEYLGSSHDSNGRADAESVETPTPEDQETLSDAIGESSESEEDSATPADEFSI
jgi:chromosome partitioning protein